MNVREFASLPDIDGVAARMMNLVDEPGTRRLFVNDMRGPIYSISYDGKSVTLYVDINDARWGVERAVGRPRARLPELRLPSAVRPAGHARLRQVLHLHRHDESDAACRTSRPPTAKSTHDTVLLEWTAKTPGAATYDGDAPRELFRLRQPFANHNAGHLAFNPLAAPGSPEFGLLYIGVADGGSGGDPHAAVAESQLGLRQDLPHRSAGDDERQQEVRHPSRLTRSSRRPARFPRSMPTAFAIRNASRGTRATATCSSPTSARTSSRKSASSRPAAILAGTIGRAATASSAGRRSASRTRGAIRRSPIPIAECGQIDPLLQGSSAASGLIVYRGNQIKQLANLVIFTDMPSGEIFYVSADKLPAGGQDSDSTNPAQLQRRREDDARS